MTDITIKINSRMYYEIRSMYDYDEYIYIKIVLKVKDFYAYLDTYSGSKFNVFECFHLFIALIFD